VINADSSSYSMIVSGIFGLGHRAYYFGRISRLRRSDDEQKEWAPENDVPSSAEPSGSSAKFCETCSEINIYDNLDLNPGKKEIRLLRILATDNWNEPLTAHLTVQSLGASPLPSYIALSYRCGSLSAVDPFNCNGSPLTIYQNLDCALRTLRSSGYTLVWADQVCINQKALHEKSSQVLLMTDIFRSATKVLIYLGEENEWSTPALNCLEEMTELEAAGQRNNIEIHPFSPTTRDSFNRTIWTKWFQFYNYEWFSRVWVIQENLVAQDSEVAVGNRRFPGWVLFAGINYVLNHLDDPELVGRDLQYNPLNGDQPNDSIETEKVNLLRTWQYFKRGYWTRHHLPTSISFMDPSYYQRVHLELWNSMHEIRSFQSTDPRDRLYALRCFLDEEIMPDYGSSVQEVYTQLARRYIGRPDGGMAVLRVTGRHQQRLNDLPSWVPDWTMSEVWDFLGLKDSDISRELTGTIKEWLRPSENGNDLWVKGAVIDSLLEMTEPWECRRGRKYYQPENYTSAEWVELLDWHQRARLFVSRTCSQRYPRRIDRLRVLVRLLTLDAFRRGPRNIDPSGIQLYLKAIEETKRYSQSQPPIFSSLNFDNGLLFAMIKHMAVLTQSQRLSVTRRGFFALIPANAQPGDKVCLVPGLGCPAILRTSNLSNYTLIGGALIMDIMDGQGLQWTDSMMEIIVIS
jgi:hypothetical protein